MKEKQNRKVRTPLFPLYTYSSTTLGHNAKGKKEAQLHTRHLTKVHCFSLILSLQKWIRQVRVINLLNPPIITYSHTNKTNETTTFFEGSKGWAKMIEKP